MLNGGRVKYAYCDLDGLASLDFDAELGGLCAAAADHIVAVDILDRVDVVDQADRAIDGIIGSGKAALEGSGLSGHGCVRTE